MRTTINLDDELLSEAQRLTGVNEEATLIHAGLRALIGSVDAQRMAFVVSARSQPKPVRQPGSARGLLKVLSEDDQHLVDFQDYMS